MSDNFFWLCIIAVLCGGPIAATTYTDHQKQVERETTLKLQLEQEKTKQALILANAGCKP